MHLTCEERPDMISSEWNCKWTLGQEFTAALKRESLFHCYMKPYWWVQGSDCCLRTDQARLWAGIVQEGRKRRKEWHLVLYLMMPAGTSTLAKSEIRSSSDFKLTAQCRRDLRSSGQLRSDVSGQLSVPSSRAPEDWTHRLSHNDGKELPLYAAG